MKDMSLLNATSRTKINEIKEILQFATVEQKRKIFQPWNNEVNKLIYNNHQVFEWGYI